MKSFRRILSVCLCAVMLVSSLCVSAVTMYTLDGRKIEVSADKVEAQKSVGWYNGQVLKVFSKNGNSRYIGFNDLLSNLFVGWYPCDVSRGTFEVNSVANPEVYCDNNITVLYEKWYRKSANEFMTKLWAINKSNKTMELTVRDGSLNGNTESVFDTFTVAPNTRKAIEFDFFVYNNEYKNVDDVQSIGFTLVVREKGNYSSDISKPVKIRNFVAEYKALNGGKFNGFPKAMYAADGSVMLVGSYDVESYKKVGWYEEPLVVLWALDGRTKKFESSKVDENRKVGWYYYNDYIVAKVKQLKASYGNNTAMEFLEGIIEKETDLQKKNYCVQKKEELRAEWYAKNNWCPMIIIAKDTGRSYGVPEAQIQVRNLTGKRIVSFELNFTCYDYYGNRTTDYPNLYNGTYNGWVDAADLQSGELSWYYWDLYSNTRTASIGNIYVKKVAFEDGTTWYR